VALALGTRLGPYEILSAIGAGGMGEVYRARDTKLNRDVALKILPDAFALDGDRIARFRREAQVLASLNHPNIAAIHGFEDSGSMHALVLEFVDGPTLADRIAKGPIPLDEALPMAKQIVEALEAAHEQGIIHRDLKPANIKLRDDGTVKVLDFGLAKALEPASAISPAFTASPTITTPAQMTGMGMILGTAAYMSPEQAKGRPADKRSDIWAFGCVLFEMLSGTRAFDGEDVSDTLAFVLTRPPAWDALPWTTPASIRRLLQRSVEKDRKRRLADISDARLDIDEALSATATELSAAVTADQSRAGWRSALPWIAAAALAVMAAGLAFVLFSTKPPAVHVINSSLLPPGGTEFNFAGGVGLPALAPDGSRVVFGAVSAASTDNKIILYVRRLDTSTAQALPGSEDAAFPFWSPDSRWVAFEQRGTLKKIDTQGGPPITLGTLPSGIRGGTWSPAGVILVAANGAIMRMSEAGGTASVVIPVGGNTYPWFLPDGRHFLYGLRQAGDIPLRVASIDEPGKPGKVVAQVHSNAMYAQGHLLYLRDRTLMAQPFDPQRVETTGEAVPIAEGISTFQSPSRAAGFTVSATGLLVYTSSPASGNARLVWKDRQGKAVGTLGEANGFVAEPALSPDGKHVAIAVLDTAASTASTLTGNIWIVDTDTGIPTRFTFGTSQDRYPVWSRDGSTIYFSSNRNGKTDLYRQAWDRAAQEEVVVSSGGIKIASDISPDGQLLMYSDADPSNARPPSIWVTPLATARTETKAEPRLFLQERSRDGQGVFRPDGHWVAYVATAPEGNPEVYIVPFPGPGGRRQVSSGGRGSAGPQWRRDGKELFYETRAGDIVAAEVIDHGGVLEIGKTQKVFGGLPTNSRAWTVSADGQKVLVAEQPGSEAARPLTLVENWAAGIRK
jgi:serine/threonine protein kinase/Tol biopolymer transport system component